MELDFASDHQLLSSRAKRTKMLHIPVHSPYHDFANLDSALWTLSQKDRDLKRILREQELIYFNSILSFTFMAFDAEKQTWNPVDPTSSIKIPEKTYLKVQLDHRPKNQTPPSLPLPVDMNPCRLIAKKLENGQSSSSRPEVSTSKDQPASFVPPIPSVPVESAPANVADPSEQDRQSAFEKLFFIDDDEEAEKQLTLAAQAHERKEPEKSPETADSDSDEDDRLMIDEDREEHEEPSTSNVPKSPDVMDLDNDDVDLDEWKQMLGIGDDKLDTEETSTNSNKASTSSPGLPRFPSEPVQMRPVAEVIPFQREPDVPLVILDSKSESDTPEQPVLGAHEVQSVPEITIESEEEPKTAATEDGKEVIEVDEKKCQHEIDVVDLEDGEILSENEEQGENPEFEVSKTKGEKKVDSPESPESPGKRSKKKKSRRRRDDHDSDESSDSGLIKRSSRRKHSKRKSRRQSRARNRSRSPEHPLEPDFPSEPSFTQQNNLPYPKPCVPPTGFQPFGPYGPNCAPIRNQFGPPRPWMRDFGPHVPHPHPHLGYPDSSSPFSGYLPGPHGSYGPPFIPYGQFPPVRAPNSGMSLPRPFGMGSTPHMNTALMSGPPSETPSRSYQYQAEKYHKKSTKSVAPSGPSGKQNEEESPNQSRPTEGQIYASTLGLNFKNPVQGLHEYCTKKGWKTPIFSVKETCKVNGLAQWKMKVMVNGQTYFCDKFYDSKKNTKRAAAKAALKACGIKLH